MSDRDCAELKGMDLTLSSTWPSCSFTYCCVRAAKGVKEALLTKSASHGSCKADSQINHSACWHVREFFGTYVKFFPNAETLSMLAVCCVNFFDGWWLKMWFVYVG